MKVYNTLTRKKQELKPITGNALKIYSCGPTVYNFAHIGNLRTYIFMDELRRTLRFAGFCIQHVMNITDVGHLVSDSDEGEDKMLKGAREQKKTPWEIADFYTHVFLKDLTRLNIEIPEILCKATAHIPEMIAFVQGLMEKGFAYETSDGIYFDIQKFEGYGKLSRANLEEQWAGARVDVNDEKHHPADFALWKKAPKEHIMQWQSPWGMGYPGWHIECSAMARKYLGDTFDIHTGGVDHIPIHHENEIAQSEALLGKPAVNYWMHGEFMMVNNGKMSKSLGNVYTIDDLMDKGFHPLAFRYFCLNAHYRSKLNFTWEGMQAAQISYGRLLDNLLAHQNGTADSSMTQYQQDFENAVTDDLNLPKALGVVWQALRSAEKSKQVYEFVLWADEVLGLRLKDALQVQQEMAQLTKEDDIAAEALTLLQARQEARVNKNWAKSDEIRDTLRDMGYSVEDTPQGQKIKRL